MFFSHSVVVNRRRADRAKIQTEPAPELVHLVASLGGHHIVTTAPPESVGFGIRFGQIVGVKSVAAARPFRFESLASFSRWHPYGSIGTVPWLSRTKKVTYMRFIVVNGSEPRHSGNWCRLLGTFFWNQGSRANLLHTALVLEHSSFWHPLALMSGVQRFLDGEPPLELSAAYLAGTSGLETKPQEQGMK